MLLFLLYQSTPTTVNQLRPLIYPLNEYKAGTQVDLDARLFCEYLVVETWPFDEALSTTT
jgi:hypothetical protein